MCALCQERANHVHGRRLLPLEISESTIQQDKQVGQMRRAIAASTAMSSKGPSNKRIRILASASSRLLQGALFSRASDHGRAVGIYVLLSYLPQGEGLPNPVSQEESMNAQWADMRRGP